MKTFRQASRTATEIRYADPTAIMDTVTLKSSLQPKKAGSKTVYNARNSISAQRNITLAKPPGCTDVCAPVDQEKLAGSLTFSGSTFSKQDVLDLLDDLYYWGNLFADDMASGFMPEALTITTKPVVGP